VPAWSELDVPVASVVVELPLDDADVSSDVLSVVLVWLSVELSSVEDVVLSSV
jgi:hypothetical protein